MHICFITNEYPKTGFPHGGIGTFVKTLASQLVLKGVKVTVIGLSYDIVYEYNIDNGVEIFRLNYKKIKPFKWYFGAKVINDKISEIHKKYPIDIVETSELGLAFSRKLKGIKYIIRLHGGHHFFAESENRKINFWKGFQEKKSFKKADAFIAVSDYVKSHTEKYLSFYNKPVEKINNPININLFSPIDIETKKYSIVFVGTVCEKKGIRQLIQAFGLLKKQFPKAILNIYGRDWTFPNGKSYIQMLKQVELPKIGVYADDIYFQGTINYFDLPQKYALAEVCVFPSHMETQGLVAPEAMSMGKPVVFTNKGPGPETIVAYETGLLCNPNNPEDIAEKIRYVFENPEKAMKIGENARVEVIKKFDIEIIVEKNIEFYTKIINS